MAKVKYRVSIPDLGRAVSDEIEIDDEDMLNHETVQAAIRDHFWKSVEWQFKPVE